MQKKYWRSSSQNSFIVLPKNKTGIYASNIKAMFVTSGLENENENEQKNSTSLTKTPSAKISKIKNNDNNTHLNSGYNSNSITISHFNFNNNNNNNNNNYYYYHNNYNNQSEYSVQQDSQMSFIDQREIEIDTSSKIKFRQNSNSRFFKRTNKYITNNKSNNNKINNNSTTSSFRLVPSSALTNVDNEKLNKEIQLKNGFRPSSVFKQNTRFLKTPSNQSYNNNEQKKNNLANGNTILSARTNSSLRNIKYENESFVSKTLIGDDEVDNLNDNKNNNSNENLSNIIDDTVNSKVYPSLVRSKLSIDDKNPQNINSLNTYLPLKRSKSNLINEILQTQTNLLASTSLSSKTPSILFSRISNNNDQTLIVDNIDESEFVEILREYRQTKNADLLNQLATPINITPNTNFTNYNNLFNDNNDNNNSQILQELRVPKTNNILFSGKSNHSSSSQRFINASDFMPNTCLQPLNDFIKPDTPGNMKRTKSITNGQKLQESTFFVDYINNKYKKGKYDRIMSYLLNNNQRTQIHNEQIKQSTNLNGAKLNVLNIKTTT